MVHKHDGVLLGEQHSVVFVLSAHPV